MDFQPCVQVLQINFSSSYSITHTNNSSSNSSSFQQNRHSNPSLATVLIQCDRCLQVRWISLKLQDQTLSTETIYFQVFLLNFENSIFIQRVEMLHLHILFPSKIRLAALIREPVRVLLSSAHRLLRAARIGVGRIDRLQFSGYFSLRSEISDAMYNLLLCTFCWLSDTNRKTFSLGSVTMLAAIYLKN